MKKLLLLVALTIMVGSFPIISNAQEEQQPSEETYPYLHDINDDGLITYKDVLDYVVLTTIPKYEENQVVSSDLWLIHEVAKKLTDEDAKRVLDEIILKL